MKNLWFDGKKYCIDCYYCIDECSYLGSRYFLLEHKEFGEDVPCLIINEDDEIVAKTDDTLFNTLVLMLGGE